MNRIALGLLAATTAAMLAMVSLPAAAATTGKVEVVTSGAIAQTAGKKAASKKAKKGAAKSCGTNMYPDKKSGKCMDARDKK